MILARHETCGQYVARRLSEGWRIINQIGFNVILQSPEGIIRPVDLRNDVETLRPNAVGDETTLTKNGSGGDNYDRVDDITPDDAGTYVYRQGDTYGRDLYNLPSHVGGSGSINSITIYFRTAESTAYFKPAFKTSGVVVDGTEIQTAPAQWVTHSETWTINSVTGVAWTWSDIDALQIGISIKCASPYYGYCTQVYVEVDYTPSPLPVMIITGNMTCMGP